jgi:hypothetical protein
LSRRDVSFSNAMMEKIDKGTVFADLVIVLCGRNLHYSKNDASARLHVHDERA